MPNTLKQAVGSFKGLFGIKIGSTFVLVVVLNTVTVDKVVQ